MEAIIIHQIVNLSRDRSWLAINPHLLQCRRCQAFLSVLTRALRRARHFALAEAVPYPTKARSQSVQVRNSVRPIHLFGRSRDHDS
jgi:hypothetical protein